MTNFPQPKAAAGVSKDTRMSTAKASEPILVWAVFHWNGSIYADTIRRTRKEAIAAFVSQFVLPGKSWKTESEYGIHKAKRVQVEIWKGHQP